MKRIIFLFSFLFLFLFAINTNAEMEIITSLDGDLKTISRSEVRSLFLMKTRRTNEGDKVTLFQYPLSSTKHNNFVRYTLFMSLESYNRELDRITNAGLGTFIHIVKDKDEMINKVSYTFNSIGYIDTDILLINSGDYNVKKVRIID